jgi:hypothetical protein
MKRKMKRLTLNRETVRALDTEEFAAVQGGASNPFCPVFTAYTCTANSCPTECPRTYCCAV